MSKQEDKMSGENRARQQVGDRVLVAELRGVWVGRHKDRGGWV